jgi:hypothetical protein
VGGVKSGDRNELFWSRGSCCANLSRGLGFCVFQGGRINLVMYDAQMCFYPTQMCFYPIMVCHLYPPGASGLST